jgi:polysaccharide export outer membrane protein
MIPARTILLTGLLTFAVSAPAQQEAQNTTTTPAPASAPACTPAATQDTASTPPPEVGPSYILGPEDGIAVNVWKEPTLSGPLLIRPDGKMTMPLLGDLTAAGLTPMALAAAIADGLKNFLTNPTVTVTVTAFNSRRIYFIGEVAHAGPMTLTRPMTVLQAIASAGGLSIYANKHHIYILRMVNGVQQKLPYDYSKALKTGNDQGIHLIPGDTIVVP